MSRTRFRRLEQDVDRHLLSDETLLLAVRTELLVPEVDVLLVTEKRLLLCRSKDLGTRGPRTEVRLSDVRRVRIHRSRLREPRLVVMTKGSGERDLGRVSVREGDADLVRRWLTAAAEGRPLPRNAPDAEGAERRPAAPRREMHRHLVGPLLSAEARAELAGVTSEDETWWLQLTSDGHHALLASGDRVVVLGSIDPAPGSLDRARATSTTALHADITSVTYHKRAFGRRGDLLVTYRDPKRVSLTKDGQPALSTALVPLRSREHRAAATGLRLLMTRVSAVTAAGHA